MQPAGALWSDGRGGWWRSGPSSLWLKADPELLKTLLGPAGSLWRLDHLHQHQQLFTFIFSPLIFAFIILLSAIYKVSQMRNTKVPSRGIQEPNEMQCNDVENRCKGIYFLVQRCKKTPLPTHSSFKGELNENGHNRGLHKQTLMAASSTILQRPFCCDACLLF